MVQKGTKSFLNILDIENWFRILDLLKQKYLENILKFKKAKKLKISKRTIKWGKSQILRLKKRTEAAWSYTIIFLGVSLISGSDHIALRATSKKPNLTLTKSNKRDILYISSLPEGFVVFLSCKNVQSVNFEFMSCRFYRYKNNVSCNYCQKQSQFDMSVQTCNFRKEGVLVVDFNWNLRWIWL